MSVAIVLAACLIESIEDISKVIAAEAWWEMRIAAEAIAPAVPRNLGFMPCVMMVR